GGSSVYFFCQAEDGIRDFHVTGVQTCALPILAELQRIFDERHQQAQAQAKPERKVWEPDGAPRGLLVALHGAGGSILTEGDYWQIGRASCRDRGQRLVVCELINNLS